MLKNLTPLEFLRIRFANHVAFRIAVAGSLALIIALIWPHQAGAVQFGWFAPFSVIINLLMFPRQDKFHQIFWERWIGVLIGAVSGVLFVYLFFKNPLLLGVFTFLSCVFCMYQVGNHHRYHYGYFLCMIFIILPPSFYYTGLYIGIDVFWEFPLTVLLGLCCIFITDKIFPPKSINKEISECLKKIGESFLSYKKDDQDELIDLNLLNYFKTILQSSGTAMSAFKIAAYEDLINFLSTVSVPLNLMCQGLENAEKINPDWAMSKRKLKKAWQDFLKIRVDLIQQDSFILHDFFLLKTALKQFEAALKEFKYNAQVVSEEYVLVTAHYYHCVFHESVLDAQKFLKFLEFLKPKDLNPNQNSNQKTLDSLSDFLEFSKIDFGTKPNQPAHHVHHAKFNLEALNFSLRTNIAVAISLGLVVLLNIPGGVQTMVATIVTAIMPNIGSTVFKMCMRLGGIIVGGVFALLASFLMAKTASFALLMALFFGFTFWASRWCLLLGKYSYAGIQAALFFLILINASGSSYMDIGLAQERFTGVFFGALVSFIVVALLIPTYPNKKRDVHLKNIKNNLSVFLKNLGEFKTEDLKIKLEELIQIEKELEQAHTMVEDARYLLIPEGGRLGLIKEIKILVTLIRHQLNAWVLLERENLSETSAESGLGQYLQNIRYWLLGKESDLKTMWDAHQKKLESLGI